MSKSVLIIDYDKRDAEAASRYLQGHGYRATVITQGETAVRTFREGDFDLILVNLLMPDVSGVEICKRLKSYDQGIRTPVYFLSPLATGHNLANRQNGAEGTLTKPINLGQLREIAEKHLGPGDPDILEETRRAQSASARERTKPDAAPSTAKGAEAKIADGGPDQKPGKDKATTTTARETRSAKTVDSRPGRENDARVTNNESDTGVWRKSDEKPAETGRIERQGMGRLFAYFHRKKATGRLELESEGRRIAIRFDAGFVVGLSSGDFIPYLVRQGKLSEADADKVKDLRQRRRTDVIEILKSEKMIGAVEVDMLVDRWRIQALKDAALLKLGDYRFYQTDVVRTIHVDPLILVHHHFRSSDTGPSLAAQVEADLRAERPLLSTSDPLKRLMPSDPDLALVMHAADAGASLAQVRDLFPKSRDADAAAYALWLNGHITQDPTAAWRAPISTTVPPPKMTPSAAKADREPQANVIPEILPDEPIFAMEPEFDVAVDVGQEKETPKPFVEFDSQFDAEFESEFDAITEAIEPPAPSVPAAKNDDIDDLASSLFADEFQSVEDDVDFVDPDFEGLTPSSSEHLTHAESPIRPADRGPKTHGRQGSESSAPMRASRQTVDELQAEIDDEPVDRPANKRMNYPGADFAPAPHVTTDELLRRGDELMRDRVYSKAQDFYSEVVLREPKNADAWTRLARAQFRNKFEDRLDRTLDAVRSCRKAIAVKHDFLGAYQTLIKIFDEENKTDIARSVALQALEYHPGDEELAKRLRTIERRIKRAAT